MEPVKFTPPLYKQRYQFVKDLVEKHKPKKVADLGCGECSLLWQLKFCSSIEVLAGIDINEDVMKEKIIEHLEAEELAAFPDVVFGFLAPTMVVISTPNSEFNSLLPGVKLFRHLDHKFEWNKEEFKSWASDVAVCYGYTVEFTGVGKPPPGAEDVGFCTQIGIFVRDCVETADIVTYKMATDHVYKTIFKAVYPSLQDEKYLQYAVVSEVLYQAHRIKTSLWDGIKAKENGNNQCPEKEQCCWPSGHCVTFLRNLDLREHEKLTENRDIEPFIHGNAVCIPLEKLYLIPRVKQLCGTFAMLIKMITGKVALTIDGSSVVVSTDDGSE
ncbi:small RNA 2'-O-methyltransferase isoform X2 [Rhinatrema bivittatum]|uniref:small RNA 2'-O-methyltransferase isoform X2 n=1 Tax=Rhinatrema bivittatum TaxID=194408 RepID=UPI00112E0C6B|nr:small RNA 2'-O-methyltransferase isoform X2 [Rhinatrema bivittatum]